MPGITIPSTVSDGGITNFCERETPPLTLLGQVSTALPGKLKNESCLLAILVAKDVGAYFAVVPCIAAGDLPPLEDRLMKQLKNRAVAPANDVKCFIARPTIAIDGKIIVEARRLNDS